MNDRALTLRVWRIQVATTLATSILAGLFCAAAVAKNDNETDLLTTTKVEVVVSPPATKKDDKPPAAAADPQKKTNPAGAAAAKTDDKAANKADNKPANKSDDKAANKSKAEADKAANKAKVEKARKTAVRQRAALQRPNGPAANLNIEQQIRRHLEPMLKAELSFANRSAGLNDDERRKLITASEKWFDAFLGPFIKHQDPNQQQMMLQGDNGVWFGGQTPHPEDPRKTIQTGVAKVVSETLPKEKRDKYNEEVRKREDFLRAVTVDNLVARVDEKVNLSAQQRNKITSALLEHWDNSATPQLEAFAINSQMWPGVQDQWLLPELTPAQQNVLRRLNNGTSGQVFFGGMDFGMGGEVIDDIDLNEKPADAKKGE